MVEANVGVFGESSTVISIVAAAEIHPPTFCVTLTITVPGAKPIIVMELVVLGDCGAKIAGLEDDQAYVAPGLLVTDIEVVLFSQITLSLAEILEGIGGALGSVKTNGPAFVPEVQPLKVKLKSV